MAKTRLEIQKQILQKLNERVDSLVSEILEEAEVSKATVDPKSFAAINTIINKLETMDFNGNTDLLRETVGVYQNAINKIDEQLKSESIGEYEQFSVDSLKEARKLIEAQSKDGRVGTIFEKVQELTEEEMSGRMEEDYNNEKIEEYDYAIKEHKKEEAARVEPFNKIITITRKNREEVDKIQSIIDEIDKLNEKKQKLEQELKNPKVDKEEIKEQIGKIDEKIKKVASTAKENKDDKSYSLSENEKMEDYIARIKLQLKKKSEKYEQGILNDLETIKDLEVDLGTGKQKVEDYLQAYINKTKKVYDLTDKLTVDKQLLRKNIKSKESHKELEELEEKKGLYEERNEQLYDYMDEYEKPEPEPEPSETQMEVYEKKGRFGRFISFLKNKFHIGNRRKDEVEYETSDDSKMRDNVSKTILKELEKETRNKKKSFRDTYTLKEKERIAANVTNTINNKREKYYKSLEEQEEKE